MATAKDVLKLIKDQDVKYVDLPYPVWRGQWSIGTSYTVMPTWEITLGIPLTSLRLKTRSFKGSSRSPSSATCSNPPVRLRALYAQ